MLNDRFLQILQHIIAFRNSCIYALIEAREARRPNPPTTHPNSRKYARCEWKCIAFIGTEVWHKPHNKAIRKGTIHRVSSKQPEPVPMNAMHCNGQRGDSLIEEDTRRPKKSLLNPTNHFVIIGAFCINS